MEKLNSQRSFIVVLLLNIITFGIYGCYLIYAMAREVNLACAADGKKTNGLIVMFLLSIITFGIYSFIWLFQISNRMKNAGANIDGGNILLWNILGSFIIVGPFIAMYKIINALNFVNDHYNTSH